MQGNLDKANLQTKKKKKQVCKQTGSYIALQDKGKDILSKKKKKSVTSNLAK